MNNINFTFHDLEKCTKRELTQRRRVYPQLVARMSAIAEYFEP
jgi:hypothetical protein